MTRVGALRAAAIVVAVVAGLAGLYLLAWAGRWPHSDMRNNGATFVGVTALLCSVGGVAFAARVKRPVWLAAVALVSVTAIAVSLLALDVVTENQWRACGNHRVPACASLLPGLNTP